MESLIAFLNEMPPGDIKDSLNLQKLLSECWTEFEGYDSDGMQVGKLGRMEKMNWNPPKLEFTLVLYGGTVKGATRAEVQHWTVDIEKKTVKAKSTAYPQMVKRSSPFYVKPIADELAQSIIKGEQHHWLLWAANDRVQILDGRILHGGNRKTLEGRRKRLNQALEQRLAPQGWKRCGMWWEHNL